MCFRPLHIRANNVYRNTNVSACSYDVPCGRCTACRDQYQSVWKCRLWHELISCYNKNGVAVFLTFTYRDSCLPSITIDGVNIPVFNHSDIKTFLNRLKINMYRLYGKSSYKYFVAMEYGKNTKRQHLHGLFFLTSVVDYRVFVELCRSLWDYGFMFPKLDKRSNQYVKDDGTDDNPCIRSAVKGCVYVSKYVTKDLSFYDIPSVDAAVKSDNTFARTFGPKHYQSNNLGISILDSVDLSDNNSVVDFLSNGISVPFSKTKIPVPRYIKKKLLYDTVISNRLGRNSKPLYDSVPSTLCLAVRSVLYENKVSTLVQTIKRTFARYKALCPSFLIPVGVDYDLLANYILYFKNVDSNVLFSFLTYFDGDMSSFADSSKVGFFYNLSKDNHFLKLNSYVTDSIHPLSFSSVFDAVTLNAYSLFKLCSVYCERVQVTEFKKRSDERDNLRYKYQYKYDKKYC